MRKTLLAGVIALAIGGVAHAQMIGPSPAGSPRATADFIKQASQSDDFERQEGRLAGQKAHDPAVRTFARKMVKDHTMTTNGMKLALRKAGIAPPPPPPLTADQSHLLHQLAATRGAQFDRVYIDQQITAHQNALQLMNGFAQAGTPAPLQEAAKKTAPMVQHHLDMAQQIQARIGS
jgi:putative membrane protein